MKTTLTPDATREAFARLDRATAEFARDYPGVPVRRQPVHTVYGGAHLFRADVAPRIGVIARRVLDEHAPDAATFARALGLEPGSEAPDVYARVVEKLAREPVEDYRIDFEDGFGSRPDAEEDAAAASAARELARGMYERCLPPFVGIRIKSFEPETRARAVRTLDVFLTTLTGESAGILPANFVVTLPKVTTPEQVTALVDVFELLEPALGFAPGFLHMEVMVEAPQAIVGPRGELNLPLFRRAARGRLTGAHFGTYDYTAGCDVVASEQAMGHPACDFARHMMQVAFARTGVLLSDGATTVLPIAPHRAPAKGADPLTPAQVAENRAVVHAAWRLHADNVRDSLARGFYQGWDLHPAQIPARYAAVYAFFRAGLDAASRRLTSFVDRAAQASRVGAVFDDAATGQGLVNYFLRALNSGALTEDEAVARSGLTLDELRGRSFARIVAARAKGAPTPV